jgi:hypothetical protein
MTERNKRKQKAKSEMETGGVVYGCVGSGQVGSDRIRTYGGVKMKMKMKVKIEKCREVQHNAT